jgi:hypothetical protein
MTTTAAIDSPRVQPSSGCTRFSVSTTYRCAVIQVSRVVVIDRMLLAKLSVRLERLTLAAPPANGSASNSDSCGRRSAASGVPGRAIELGGAGPCVWSFALCRLPPSTL